MDKLSEIEGKKIKIIELENGRIREWRSNREILEELTTYCREVFIKYDDEGKIEIIQALQCNAGVVNGGRKNK
ncbi:MAG: hypothetical protein QXE46_00445 [Candidatus Thermoplasmatota archaeon]